MTDVKNFLNKFNLNDKEAALILGVTRQTIKNWESGKVETPLVVVKLLRLIVEEPRLINKII